VGKEPGKRNLYRGQGEYGTGEGGAGALAGEQIPGGPLASEKRPVNQGGVFWAIQGVVGRG